MAQKDLIVNNENLSALYPDGSYRVDFESIDGTQGGVMLSGGETVDELKLREIVTFPLFPLTDLQVQNVLALVMVKPVHTVHYFSPWKGERTIEMIRTVRTARYRGKGLNGETYWTGLELSFREKE